MTARIANLVTLAAGLVALLLAAPAGAAQVKDVRVGQHPTFTRIVFELDAPAGYRVSRSANPDGSTDIVVTLDASGGQESLRSASSLVRGVSVEAGSGRSTARIHLRDAGLPLKEMILRDPPRIVLDVMGEDQALARARAARQARAQAKPAPPAEPKPEPEVAKAEPAPAPARKAAPEPAPEPEPAPSREEPPAPAPEVARAETPEAAPAERPPRATPDAVETPARDKQAEDAAREAMEKRLAAVRRAQEERMREAEAARQARAEPESEPEPEPEPPARAEPERPAASRSRSAPQAEPADTGFGLGFDPLVAGAIAGGVLLLLVFVLLLRRRRSLPKNLDVTTLADEEPEADARIPAGGFSTDEDDSATPFGTAVAEAQEDVVVGVTSGDQPPLAGPGLFEEAEKGDTEMDQQGIDLGMDTSSQGATKPAMGGGDVSARLAEFERRIAQLEGRLDEEVAARERLERQVAAQSEELRVQRAAIARTQRALRGMTRSEEEQATEPALRDS